MKETKIGKAILAESAESGSVSAFVKRPAADWMRLAGEKPPQRRLLGDLISENELAVVFSMTKRMVILFSATISSGLR